MGIEFFFFCLIEFELSVKNVLPLEHRWKTQLTQISCHNQLRQWLEGGRMLWTSAWSLPQYKDCSTVSDCLLRYFVLRGVVKWRRHCVAWTCRLQAEARFLIKCRRFHFVYFFVYCDVFIVVFSLFVVYCDIGTLFWAGNLGRNFRRSRKTFPRRCDVNRFLSHVLFVGFFSLCVCLFFRCFLLVCLLFLSLLLVCHM